MYVVFETGGKQYRARLNGRVNIEKMPYTQDASLEFSGFSFSDDATALTPVKILAKPLGEMKADKVLIFRKTRRHNFRRKKGHRQPQLQVQIHQIVSQA